MSFDPTPYAPTEGPCDPWITIADVRACGLDEATVPDSAVQFGIALASRVLWAKTGRRYGICRRTAKPCSTGEHDWAFVGISENRHDDMNQHVHRHQPGACRCWLSALELPGPIAAVESVVYDGVVLPETAYAVKTTGHRARRVVLRIDLDSSGNPERWWNHNDIYRDPTASVLPDLPDEISPAWQVTWHQGRAVPEEGQGAAAILAEQFARARCGGPCTEPISTGLTQVARRGSTRKYDPPTKGRTGNPIVDEWIGSVNPFGRVRGSWPVRADTTEPRRLWDWIETPAVVP
jgi:hypothetical protein